MADSGPRKVKGYIQRTNTVLLLFCSITQLFAKQRLDKEVATDVRTFKKTCSKMTMFSLDLFLLKWSTPLLLNHVIVF
ncbi:hypothetical protein ACHQM5_026249 [Ranunculus cassubicifolius]